MGGVIAGVLAARGGSALVFHGDDGLDELTTTDDLHRSGWCTVRRWPRPARSGRAGPAPVGAAATCAVATPPTTRPWLRAVLAGEAGPVRDTVLLNAAAALAAAEGVRSPEDLARRCPPGWPGPRQRWIPVLRRRCWRAG